MFVSPDIPCSLTSAALKLETIADVDHRVAHVTAKVEPFTPELARELGDHIYDHLFMRDLEHPDVPMPRPEITQVAFALRVGLQQVVTKDHPDLSASGALRRVKVASVRVTRPNPDVPRLTLAFVLSVELGDQAAREWLVRAFGRTQYLTFLPEQRHMLGHIDPAIFCGAETVTFSSRGRSVTLGRKGSAACDHGVDITSDTCPACESDAQAMTEEVVAQTSKRKRGAK
jgi:hypothetical protein